MLWKWQKILLRKSFPQKAQCSQSYINVSKSMCQLINILGVCQVALYKPLNGTSFVLFIYCQFPFCFNSAWITFNKHRFSLFFRSPSHKKYFIRLFSFLNNTRSSPATTAQQFAYFWCNKIIYKYTEKSPIYLLKSQKWFWFIITQWNQILTFHAPLAPML